MRSLYTFIFCLIGLLIASPTMAAKVYKWVDENGVVNFSEHPPKNTPTTVIRPKTGHSEPVTYDPPGQPAASPAVTDTAQQSRKDPERCEISKKNLEVLRSFGRVRVPNEDGSFHYLTEQEQQERLQATQKAIEESC
jgi:hypothetical protein